MTKHTDSSRSADSDSSAPNVHEVTRLSGEQAEERTAREGRAKEWLGRAFTEKWNCQALDFSNNHVIGESVQTLSELLAEYAESECSRLASRVEELEKLIAKQSGCSRCNDSASGGIPTTSPTEIRRSK